MARIIIAVEDLHYGVLDTVLQIIEPRLAGPRRASKYEFFPMKGHGNVEQFLKKDWDRLRDGAFDAYSGTWDRAFVVIDGDRCDRILACGAPPKAPATTDSWYESAQQSALACIARLRPQDAASFLPFVIRWNQESLLLAAFSEIVGEGPSKFIESVLPDRAAREAAFDKYLSTNCNILGQSVDPRHHGCGTAFVQYWRRPGGCFADLLEAIGSTPFAKSDPTCVLLAESMWGNPNRVIYKDHIPDVCALANAILISL